MMSLPRSKKNTSANKLSIQKEMNFEIFFSLKSMNSISIKKSNVQKSPTYIPLLGTFYLGNNTIYLLNLINQRGNKGIQDENNK